MGARDKRAGVDGFGLLIGAASPVFQSLVPILVALGLEGGVAIVPLLAARTGIAAVAAWAIVVAAARGLPGRRPLDARLLVAGIAGVAVGPLGGYVAIDELGPTMFAAIYFLHVPLLAVAVPLLAREPPHRITLLGACGCVAGVALVSGYPGADGSLTVVGLLGVLVNIAGVVVMALLIGAHRGRFDVTRFNAEAMTLAAAALALLYVGAYADTPLSGRTWLVSAAIALGAWLPGRLLWTLAVQRIGARAATILSALQPMLVALLGLLVLGDALDAVEWLGILVICLSVATARSDRMAVRRRRQRP
jgi:drug/metabolite transporter (DMT)-like permease